MEATPTHREPSLADRLDLLEQAAVITHRARAATEAAMARVEAFAGLPVDATDAGQVATHLAMALTRLDRGEPEPDLPDVVSAEIAERHEERALVEALAAAWRHDFGRPLPETEIAYLVVHLAVLREKAALGG